MHEEDADDDLPKNRLWQPVTIRWFVCVFGATLAYAIVRYQRMGYLSLGLVASHMVAF